MSSNSVSELNPCDWSFAGRQRTMLYEWFSTLFAREVSEEMVNALMAGETESILGGLADLGLRPEVERLKRSVAIIKETALARLELAADFAQLFLLDGKTGALPYASVYEPTNEGASLYAEPEARMKDFLASCALAIQSDFREPADHLSVYLALMARLAGQDADSNNIAAAALDQAIFIRTGLLNWLPLFVQRCQQATPQFDFYSALAALLVGFVLEDEKFLRDIAQNGELPA